MPSRRAANQKFEPSVKTASKTSLNGAPPGAETLAGSYVRARDLPKLVGLWPHEIEPSTACEHARLLAKLRRALRAERRRGLSGHWAYDLVRHAQLVRAYRAEVAAWLGAQRNGEGGSPAREAPPEGPRRG